MPSTTQLEYILAVDRSGHFGRAAESCGVSQPTLSAQIKKVEQELGIMLFDRSSKPIRATLQGRALLVHAREVIDAYQRLCSAASDASDRLHGEFVLGVIPTVAPYTLPWFLERFADRHPEVELKLREKPTDDLIEALLLGKIAAALLATPLHESSILEVPIFYDPFYLYAHPEEAPLQTDTLCAENLDPAKLWLLEDGHCVRAQVSSFCGARQGAERLTNVSFSAGSFETLRNLIDALGGYSLFPETYVRTLPREVRRQQVRAFSAATPTREISVAHSNRSWKIPVVDAIAAALKDGVPRALRQNSPHGEILSLREERL